MHIDKDALQKLLSLNDRQLLGVIERLVKESGIDPSQFNVDPQSISSIRTAISSATEEELNEIIAKYEANKQLRGVKNERK